MYIRTVISLVVLATISVPVVLAQGPAGAYSASGYTNELAGQGGIITVVNRAVSNQLVIGGTVVPLREVTLTAQLPGRVDFIAGREGDWFQQNQLVVAINNDKLVARRNQALASLGGIDSSYRNAHVQYSREFWSPTAQPGGSSMGLFPSMFERFFGGGGGPWAGYNNPWIERQANLYSQGSGISRARSEYYGALSRVEEIDAAMRDAAGIAPFDGVIVEKYVEVGDTVQPGQKLVRYIDTRYLQLQAEVPVRLASGLHRGMVTPARLDAQNSRIDVRVAQIFPIADSQRHTVTVKFDLPEGIAGGPGMYAEVMLPEVDAPVRMLPVIPASAVVWRGSLPGVFVQNSDNRSDLRLIRLGEVLDQNTVAVLSGIRAGDRVFASPPPGMSSSWQVKHENSLP